MTTHFWRESLSMNFALLYGQNMFLEGAKIEIKRLLASLAIPKNETFLVDFQTLFQFTLMKNRFLSTIYGLKNALFPPTF